MARMLKGSVVGTVSLCVTAVFGVIAVPSVSAATNADQAISTQAPGVRASSKLTFNSGAARFGATNSQSVRNLQTLLIRKRYATAGLAQAGATGSYYKQTKASVKKLQRKIGYSKASATGIIEKRSAKRLGLRWVTSSGSASLSVGGGLPSGNNGSALSPNQLKSVLAAAGFAEPHIRTAWGIAMRESRAYPRAVSPLNSNGTRDHGLFQINDVHKPDLNLIYDPLYNAQVAFRLSGGKDFSHWGIGDKGWAGTLKRTQPAYWQMLQDEMVRFRNQYPG